MFFHKRWLLGNGRNRIVRVSHLGENFVEPLKRPVKVNLNPARCGCHVLSVIFSSPTFEEREERKKKVKMTVGSKRKAYHFEEKEKVGNNSDALITDSTIAQTFDEAHSDGAHFGQLKHGLEAVVDGLRQ